MNVLGFERGRAPAAAVSNSATMEAISAENGGTMTFIKENSPTSFVVEQMLRTMAGAKTLALDTKTNHVLTMTAEFGPAAANADAPRVVLWCRVHFQF